MTLRARLLAGLLGLVAVGLIVSNVVTYRALREFLFDRVDQQLANSIDPLASQLTGRARITRGPTAAPASAPAGTWAAVIHPDGRVKPAVVGYPGQDPTTAPRPRYTAEDLTREGAFTVPGTDGERFRMAVSREADGDVILVAIPLHDVDQTLARLIGIEVTATVLVLGSVGLMARSLVRRGLRPLEDIGRTAGAIAAGDLSRRVEADERTEVGQLGVALNRMLGQIESAFAAQQASESRLRRFVADASHELRTPLTSIRGYAELFRRGAADRPEDLAKAMRRIEQEASRMGVLVDDLLLLARLDQGRPLERERVDLVRVATDAVDDARTVDASREISLDVPGAPVLVIGDDARLRQVAGNLLANARQHTPPGTAVRVRLDAEGGTAVLEVADDGPGLTPEQAGRVFERFYRADESRTRSHGGTGLGLAIVAAITEAHGGKAGVESEPGKGAAFRVELPLAPPGPVDAPPGDPQRSPSIVTGQSEQG